MIERMTRQLCRDMQVEVEAGISRHFGCQQKISDVLTQDELNRKIGALPVAVQKRLGIGRESSVIGMVSPYSPIYRSGVK